MKQLECLKSKKGGSMMTKLRLILKQNKAIDNVFFTSGSFCI